MSTQTQQAAKPTNAEILATLKALQERNAQLEAQAAAHATRGPGGKPVRVVTQDTVAKCMQELTAQELVARTFSSGSRGYYGSGKLAMNGLKYQVSVTLVEVGSKPAK